jgi:hypothetical protein
MPAVAQNSAFRGFLHPGTGIPFRFDQAGLGFDQGAWASFPRSGQALDDFMQQVVAGVTGLPGSLVFPRWQPEPPNLPQTKVQETDTAGVSCFAAVGVTDSDPWGFPALTELNPGAAAPTGFQRVSDQEEFKLLCSFYGPAADAYATVLRLGLMVAQNRECLQLLGIGLQQTSGRRLVPSLVQGRNLRRVDITCTFMREVQIFYPVLYLTSSPVSLTTDTGFNDTVSAR